MAGPEILIPIAFFISATSVVRMVLKHRERRYEIEAQGGSGGGRESSMRLERMEQAIDAMAVEIERISEAQRFTTRLLTEGSEQSGRLPSHDPRR